MITQIYKWKCTLRSTSPLRFGGMEDDLVVDQFERPIIPGTSLAGACRAFAQSVASAEEVDELFGSSASQARDTVLIFSDGRSKKKHAVEVRPGIRIDGATKTTTDGALFHRHMLAPGAEFDITLTLKTTKEHHERFSSIVESMLQAIHSGLIRLGAHKSIGSGKFTITSCETVHYDCTDEADLNAYVHETKPYKKMSLSEVINNESFVQITLKGKTASPLLIGGQYPNESNEPDETYITTTDGKPLIPASSLKGVLRHRVNRIANVLQLQDKDKYIAYLFGSNEPNADEGIGTLQLEDIILTKEKTKVYNRIAINPFTGGTRSGALIEEETVVGTFETNLQFQLKEKDSGVSLALLLFALRDLALGKLSIGSGAAIGRGFLNIEQMTMKEGNKEIVFDFHSEKIVGNEEWLQQLQQSLEAAK